MENISRYDVEVALLGSLMKNPSNFRSVSEIVNADCFSWVGYKYLFSAINRLIESGISVDSVTVGDELERENTLGTLCSHDDADTLGRNAILKIRNAWTSSNPISYAELLKEYSDNQKILDIMMQGSRWVGDRRKTADILADLTKQLTDVKPVSRVANSTVSLQQAIEKAYDITNKANSGNANFLKTGIAGIDYFMVGLSAPDLTIIAARPGAGKTAMLNTIVYNIMKTYKDKKVAYFSLEMGVEQVAMRFISMESGISFKQQRRGGMDETTLDKYIGTVSKLSHFSNNLYINDVPAITPKTIAQELRRVGSVDLLVVDYLQLAKPDEKNNARHLDVASVSSALKVIAKEFNIPVLVAAQLSRDVEKRSTKEVRLPVLSDLAESGKIEQDADNILFIHREQGDDLADIILAKQRNGEVGKFTIKYIGERTMFENITKKEE